MNGDEDIQKKISERVLKKQRIKGEENIMVLKKIDEEKIKINVVKEVKDEMNVGKIIIGEKSKENIMKN